MTNINWYPGHMAKAKRLMQKEYKHIDVVYELVDSRIPKSSKIANIYDIIGNKPKILIMTKKDLADAEMAERWVKYYENLGTKTLLVDLNKEEDILKIVSVTHELARELQEKREEKGLMKKDVRVLVVGIPNVGKSTLINKMCKRKVASVGNNPGVTQHLSWLRTRSDILLLDTPGILWPKLDQGSVALNLAAFTAIKQEILPVDEVAVYILEQLSEYYPDILYENYGIRKVTDIMASYEAIGQKIGAMKHGEVDYDKVPLKIVNDIKGEKIKGITFDRK